jgi:hypothetical protein
VTAHVTFKFCRHAGENNTAMHERVLGLLDATNMILPADFSDELDRLLANYPDVLLLEFGDEPGEPAIVRPRRSAEVIPFPLSETSPCDGSA